MVGWVDIGPVGYRVKAQAIDLNDSDEWFRSFTETPDARQPMPEHYDDGDFYVEDDYGPIYGVCRLNQDDLSRKSPEVVRF